MRQRSLDELIHHMGAVRDRAPNDWVRNFAGSVLRQSRNRKWKPSPKQVGMMRRLVSELFSEHEEIDLIEELDA